MLLEMLVINNTRTLKDLYFVPDILILSFFTSTASQQTYTASQLSKDLNKVPLLFKNLELNHMLLGLDMSNHPPNWVKIYIF